MRIRISVVTAVAMFGLAGGGTIQAMAQTAIKSNFCKNLYAQMKSKPQRKAFAISANGQICHAVWGLPSQSAANSQARVGCQGNGERKCSVVAIR